MEYQDLKDKRIPKLQNQEIEFASRLESCTSEVRFT